MNDLLNYIVTKLVSKPEAVKIEERNSEGGLDLLLTVDPTDMGIIIGKAGQTIRSIRKLLISRAMVENNNLRVNLILNETA